MLTLPSVRNMRVLKKFMKMESKDKFIWGEN